MTPERVDELLERGEFEEIATDIGHQLARRKTKWAQDVLLSIHRVDSGPGQGYTAGYIEAMVDILNGFLTEVNSRLQPEELVRVKDQPDKVGFISEIREAPTSNVAILKILDRKGNVKGTEEVPMEQLVREWWPNWIDSYRMYLSRRG